MTPLAVAVTLASPVLPIVAVVLERVAEAPVEGTMKVTTPPATGSPAALVTSRAEGFAERLADHDRLSTARGDREGEALILVSADVGVWTRGA